MKRIEMDLLTRIFLKIKSVDLCNFKEFDDKTEAKDYIKKKYDKFAVDYHKKKNRSDLSGYDYKSSKYFQIPLEVYCGNYYHVINKHLRDGENGINYGTEYGNRIDSIIDKLSELVISAPPLEEDIVLYRLINDDALSQVFREMEKKVYIDKGFVSTSLHWDIDCKHHSKDDNLIKIYAPKGTAGLATELLCNKNELEVILLPNTKFRYLGRVSEKKRCVFAFLIVDENKEVGTTSMYSTNYRNVVEKIRKNGYVYRNNLLPDVMGRAVVDSFENVNKMFQDMHKKDIGSKNEAVIDALVEITVKETELNSTKVGYLPVKKALWREIEEGVTRYGVYKGMSGFLQLYYALNEKLESGDVILRFRIGEEVPVFDTCEDYGIRKLIVAPYWMISKMDLSSEEYQGKRIYDVDLCSYLKVRENKCCF